MSLERADVLAFMNRDWAGARRHNDASMRHWIEVHGVAAAYRLSGMLLAQTWKQARAEKAAQDFSGLIEMRRKFVLAEANRRR